MIPRYGWSKRGVPLIDRSSYSYWKTLSCVCYISNSQVFALQTFEGGTTNEKFAAYVEQILLPKLPLNSIVVTDNLSAHKQVKIREILARKNCVPFFTPTYSPDFNPIENMFSRLKSLARRERLTTFDALREWLANVPKLFDETICRHYFQHALTVWKRCTKYVNGL